MHQEIIQVVRQAGCLLDNKETCIPVYAILILFLSTDPPNDYTVEGIIIAGRIAPGGERLD